MEIVKVLFQKLSVWLCLLNNLINLINQSIMVNVGQTYQLTPSQVCNISEHRGLRKPISIPDHFFFGEMEAKMYFKKNLQFFSSFNYSACTMKMSSIRCIIHLIALFSKIFLNGTAALCVVSVLLCLLINPEDSYSYLRIYFPADLSLFEP